LIEAQIGGVGGHATYLKGRRIGRTMTNVAIELNKSVWVQTGYKKPLWDVIAI